MNEGFGKDFYRKGNSVKRSGHSVNRRTLKSKKLLSKSTSQKSAPILPFSLDFAAILVVVYGGPAIGVVLSKRHVSAF